MKPDSILIRYAELCLKNKNRGDFEKQLKQNIRTAIDAYSPARIKRSQAGIEIDLNQRSNIDSIVERLRTIPGLSWFAPCWQTVQDPDDISGKVLDLHEKIQFEGKTFAVRTQRSNKSLPLNSEEYNQIIGDAIRKKTGFEVDLDNPDWTIHVHLINDVAYTFFRKIEGMRGLPVESTGEVLTLLSGGIDSPVASIEVMKRGCRTDFLHFHSYPTAEDALNKKISRMVDRLSKFGTSGSIYMVPYHTFDLNISSLPERLELILFRRHTLRVAERIASRENHQALVTGESIGQVASQTLENISTIASSTDLTILRPLIGRNKNEIIDLARQYETYELSIEDYQDCCAIQSRKPETKARVSDVERIENETNLGEITSTALERMKEFRYDHTGLVDLSSVSDTVTT